MVFVTLLQFAFLGALLWLGSIYYRFFIRKGIDLKRKYGEWALVTGATDGIGKAYASALAKRGINIILVSRNEAKLKETANTIKEKYHVETKFLTIDLSTTAGAEIESRIKQIIKETPVGILVNSAGIAYEFPDYFDQLTTERIDALLQLNITAVVYITRAVIQCMREQKRGCIINISSASAMVPTPLLSVYAATKAFVDFFSRGLHVEYAKENIFVQAVLPSFVCTKLSKAKKPGLSIPTPETFVSFALKTAGHDRYTTGYWFHEIKEIALLTIIPNRLYEILRMKVLLSLHVKALENEANAARKQQ